MATPSIAVRTRPPRRPLRAVPAVARAGDVVLADDGVVGSVESVLRTEAGAPVYVIVKVGRRLWRRYPVVPWSYVVSVDGARRLVRMRGPSEVIRRRPETLPIVI